MRSSYLGHEWIPPTLHSVSHMPATNPAKRQLTVRKHLRILLGSTYLNYLILRSENVMCADIVSPTVRSAMMSRIRGKNSRPELALRRQLFAAGYRFRLHRRDLPGSPDIVLPKHGAVIFVHGCFWHRHGGCAKATTPASNCEFWEAKFMANVERDAAVIERLGVLGWRVAIVWECAIRAAGLEALLFTHLQTWIDQAESTGAGARLNLLELP